MSTPTLEKHPHLLVDCKLIEDYQMSSALSGSTQIAATTFEGKPAFFSIGPKKLVFFTYRSDASRSGWAQEELKINASHITAAVDSKKGTVLMAVDNNRDQSTGETKNTIQVWHRNKVADAWQCEKFSFPGIIHRIRLKQLLGELYAMVIFRFDKEDDTFPYQLVFNKFAFGATAFSNQPTAVDSLNADFGLDAHRKPGVYLCFTPQVYWRPATGYAQAFKDEGNQGTNKGQNVTVWNGIGGEIAVGNYAQSGHLDLPNFYNQQVPLHFAFPLEDPAASGNFPKALKEIRKWKKAYDTHGTGTSNHQDFSLLQPDLSGADYKGYVTLGCYGIKNMDADLDKEYGIYALHEDFAVPAKYFEWKPDPKGVTTVYEPAENGNALDIWYTAKCGGGKKCTSVSKIVPDDSHLGLEIGTFYARNNCDRVVENDGKAYCPRKEGLSKSLLLFARVGEGPKWQAVSTLTTDRVVQMVVSESASGPSDVLCTQGNGKVWRLRGLMEQASGAWEPMASHQDVRFANVAALVNAHDDLEVIATTVRGNPFHALVPRKVIHSPLVAIEDVPTFLPVLGRDETVVALEMFADNFGNVGAFAVREDLQPQFWINDTRTGNWTRQPVHTDEKATMQEMRSFSVQITTLDAYEIPMIGVDLEIWAEGPALIKVNGRAHYVNKQIRTVQVHLPDGRCRIMVPTEGIHAPILHVHAGFMKPGEYVSISPNADLQIQLAQLEQTGGLANAQKNSLHGNPTPLFEMDAQGNQRDDLGDVSTFMSQAMKLVPNFDRVADRKYLRLNRALPPKATPKLAANSSIEEHPTLPSLHFGLQYLGGKAKSATYTPAAAAMKAQALQKTDGTRFHSSWGDVWNFFKSAGSAVANGFEIVISTVATGVRAVATFVIRGVQYIFDGVVGLVQEVFAMVEGVFAAIGLAFEDLVQWLGYLFDWEDILRTQRAITTVVNFSLDLQMQAIDSLKKSLVGFIDGVEEQYETAMDGFRDQFLAQNDALKLLSGPGKSNEADAVHAHNTVYNSFLDNRDDVNSPAPPSSIGDVFDTLLNDLSESFANAFGDQRAGELLQQFKNSSGSTDEMILSALALITELLKEIGKFILEVAESLLTALLDLVVLGMKAISDALNAPWDDCFIVRLYQAVTGEVTMSSMSLFALIMAVPVTPLFKLAAGGSPFPDAESLAQFQTQFKQILDPKPDDIKLTALAQKQFEVRARGLFAVMSSSVKAILIPADAILAILPPTPGVPATWQRPLSYLSTVLKVVEQAAQMPISFYAVSAHGGIDFGAFVFVKWSSVLMVRLMNLFNVTCTGVSFANSDAKGAIFWTVVGGICFAWQLVSIPQDVPAGDNAPMLNYGSGLLNAVPDVFSFLKLPSIVASSEGTSLVALGIVNGFFKALGLGLATWATVETFKMLDDTGKA